MRMPLKYAKRAAAVEWNSKSPDERRKLLGNAIGAEVSLPVGYKTFDKLPQKLQAMLVEDLRKVGR